MSTMNSLECAWHPQADVVENNGLDFWTIMHGAEKCSLEVPEAAEPQQEQRTRVDETYIRANFTGQERDNLLQLMNDYSIGSIDVGPNRNGQRPISINFTQDVSAAGITIPQTLSGNLRFSPNGFRIENLQGVSAGPIGVTALDYNGERLLAITEGIAPNIPVPSAIFNAAPINQALRGFR